MSDDPILAAIKALRVDLLARSDRLQDSLAEIHGDIAANIGARVAPRATDNSIRELLDRYPENPAGAWSRDALRS
jgi:hypothetical protein